MDLLMIWLINMVLRLLLNLQLLFRIDEIKREIKRVKLKKLTLLKKDLIWLN